MTGSRHSYELPFYIELDLHNMFSCCIANTCPKIEIPNQAVAEINHHAIDDDAGRTGRPASELLP